MEVDLVSSGLAEEDAVELDDYNINNNNNDVANFGGERCGICMDIIIDRGVLDCCQHWFCFVCIDNWATITNLCPLCQHEFQLITCVPVYDTIGSSKVDEESYSRDDDWCIEGKNNTLSFPSYYIDENAVICLDGDGCKIRTGSATTEGDSILDTSIACDSCDIWYHAFCVGFDPEGTTENTWLCPRCVVDEVSQKPDENLEQGSNHPTSSENANRDRVAEDNYSKKVSISVADTGETAIVVSMVGGDKSAAEPGESILPRVEVDKDLKTHTFMLTSEDNSQKLTAPSRETSTTQPSILKARELELSLSCDTSSVDKSINEHSSFGGIKSSLGEFAEESRISNSLTDNNSDMGLHLALSIGSFSSVDEVEKNGTDDKMDEDVKQNSLSEEHVFKADKNVADAGGDVSRTTGVKRKLSDSSDHIYMDTNGDAETKIEIEASSKKVRAEGKIQQILPKDQVNASASDDSKNGLLITLPGNDEVNFPEKENATSDIMSIVQGTNRRSSKGRPNAADKSSKELENVAGLRVKKIMKRAAEDKESSMAVQKLRKEIREAVHNKSAQDIGENLFDPKLLAAFRAAVAVPKAESVETLSPLAVKARKSTLQKGKVRENLTKKIYTTSNGRRKRAWDRDCEIEFWKHRCLSTSKPEKIQTLKSVLDLLRSGSESTKTEQTSERQPNNPILSRLYLADTSVFPRKDDIKPLSALKTSGDSDKQPAEKCSKASLDTSSSVETNKGVSKVGKKNNVPSLKGNAASSKAHPNRHLEGSSVSSLGSSKSNTGKEVAAKSGDLKKDKRQWAMEVLARKTSGAREGVANENQEDLAVLKGSYPLLAQLPIDMRPALASSRHNKIPISVRQAQLYHWTEHLLKKANLPVIRRAAETELAVADAINIEKEVADRSNSKPVYLNLCAQEILHRSENSKSSASRAPEIDCSLPSAVSADRSEQSENEPSTNIVIEEALKNAGLLSDSPPNSPDQNIEIQPGEGGPPTNIKEGPEDVFEMDDCPDLDIYGEFEYNLDDEDYIGVSAAKVSKVQPEDGVSKMKVVLSTFHSERSSTTLDLEKTQNLGNAEVPNDSSCILEKHSGAGFSNSTMEDGTENPCAPQETLFGEEGEELSVAECEELYGPDKEPLIKKFPEAASIKPYGLSDAEAFAGSEHSTSHETSVPNQAMKASELGNESNTEKSVSIGHNSSSAGESSPNRSELGETVRQKEKKSNTDTTKRSDNSISKKVEAYIKEHIRPLCKSGIITVEQYRWAVAKATEKVMKYHCKAKNANFLIKEGEKVKKLAEQYVEAAKEGKK